MPFRPMVQYWPALNVNPSGFSNHMTSRSAVMSSLFRTLTSASFVIFLCLTLAKFASPPFPWWRTAPLVGGIFGPA